MLSAYQEFSNPPSFNHAIIDGYFLLSTLKNVPREYRKITRQLFNAVISQSANNIDLVFHKDNTKSFMCNKDLIGKEGIGEKYDIRANNKRTTNFQILLRQRNFLHSFVKFLIDDWEDASFLHYYGAKTIRINYELCYRFKVENEQIQKELDHDFTCKQDSTDVKMVYHITKLLQDSRVKLIAQDADPVIILLGNALNVNFTIQIFAEVGINKPKLLNVNQIRTKSKKRELSILQKNVQFQEVLIKAMQVDIMSEDFTTVFSKLEQYIRRI